MKKKKDSGEKKDSIRRRLHEIRERITADIEDQLGRQLDPGMTRKFDIAMDQGDLAALDLGEGVDYRLLEMRYQTYKDIAEAFRHLEDGTYGICERCGTEIPANRLKANPIARFCVPCLSEIEAYEQAQS